MQRQKPEVLLARNRHAIVVFIVALLIFAAAIAYANTRFNHGRSSYLVAKTRVATNHDLTRKHLDDLAFLEQIEVAFAGWQASGKIGLVDEVDWVELLLDTSSTIGVEDFSHRLGEAKSLSELHGRKLQHIVVSQLDINLEFKANHGADVFQFFKEIGERAPGLFRVSDLLIERIEVKGLKRGKPLLIDETKLASGVNLATMQPLSIPISHRVDTWESEVFGGVKVTAILSSFQIEMTDRTGRQH